MTRKGLTFDVEGESVALLKMRYRNGGRTGLIAMYMIGEEIGEPCDMLTGNLPEEPLETGEFFIKDYNDHAALAQAAFASGGFEDTGKRVRSGFVELPVWRLKDGIQLDDYESHLVKIHTHRVWL